MITSQTLQYVKGFDEFVRQEDKDFGESGLKSASVIRIGRLAVVHEEMLLGAIGEISAERLQEIKKRLGEWLLKD